MSSRNNPSIVALVNAISNGLSAGQFTDLARKIAEDLDKVFTQVNTGPLPEVSGENLTHINPASIDSPGDDPQLVTDQGQVALLNVENTFSADIQSIEGTTNPQLRVGGSANTKGRIEEVGAGNIIFSSNIVYAGGAYGGDAAAVGSMVQLFGGGINFWHWTGAALVQRGSFDANGVFQIGAPTFLTGATAAEVVMQNAKSIRANNAAANGLIQMIGVDGNDHVVIGASNVVGGAGHVVIPNRSSANVPAAAGSMAGVIMIDDTNNWFVFYAGAARFRLAGVAF